MERNIEDQLKKAYEAYRQVCIERDNAKRELQQKTEYYQNYTQQLEQQIDDQNQLITKLKALLRSATKLASDEASYYPGLQKQEVESLSSCDHHTDEPSCSHQMLLARENMDTAEMLSCRLPGTSTVDNKDVVDIFLELVGDFQLIQALTRKQTNHLRKMSRRNIANEPRFSIPIQCTDVSAERSEGPLGPFSTAVESRDGRELAPATLLPGGADPEELTELSVRLPPSTESEFEFLNSGMGRPNHEVIGTQPLGRVTSVSMMTQAQSLGLPILHTGSSSSNFSFQDIYEPKQLLWKPDLCEATAQGTGADPSSGSDHSKCEFCNDLVPLAHIYSHLNSHCPASNGQ
ncbi:hypothetical protein COCON_G00196240 [Conger conger]|uniref:Tbk1/Ikki binding domain-containing protein n=1 Tax=Conger conger TaxID=82655 RepID=A0A9Q1D1E2_CONCO|nr:TRAF family member-associated NF-kappa-B activator-like [Conger conger]KAJ8255760.1 hypothetical protein COCON_G00196240 [Conger conger]